MSNDNKVARSFLCVCVCGVSLEFFDTIIWFDEFVHNFIYKKKKKKKKEEKEKKMY